jgi:hypothetical protein
MVNVTGILALETAPGLNRHRRKALTAELSRIGLPRLWAIVASVTLPVAGSTVTTQTPLPMSFLERASYGYSGLGAKMAAALAPAADTAAPCCCGRAIGATFVAGLFFGGGVGCSSLNSGSTVCGGGGGGTSGSSGGGVGSGGCSCCSIPITTASGMLLKSTGGASCFMAATTAMA